MKTFKNDNGREYNILVEVPFNKADEEYYKNSWQKSMYALLERNGEYIVASLVGEDSWGSGYYADDISDALAYLNKKLLGYLK